MTRWLPAAVPVLWVGLWSLVFSAGCFERGGQVKGEPDDAAPPIAAVARLPEVQDPDGAPDREATIRVRLEAEPAHLNPLIGGDAVALRVALGDVYEGLLCRATPTAMPVVCLAEWVRESDGGTVVRARLRDGVRFHDGAPLTIGDAVFSFELVRGGGGALGWLTAAFDDLREVRGLADGLLELRFAGPRPGRQELLAQVPILPRHVFGADAAAGTMLAAPANRAPVGTGPLRFVRWTSGQSIALDRWDGYWGESARAAHIEYRVVPSRARALLELGAGRLDVAVQLPVDEALDAAERLPRVRAFGYELPAYLAAVHDQRNPVLADVRVRRALGLLLDRPGIARRLFRGYAQPIAGPFLPDLPGADLAPLPYDRAAAAALLAETGLARPRLVVLTPAGSRTMGRIADIWASDARPFVNLVIETVPYADLLARVRAGRFDIALLAFTTAREPDLYSRFHSAEIGGENYGALRDDAIDRLLEAFRAEADPARRAALQAELGARLAELQPYTFIAGDTRLGLARADIGGLAEGGGLAARKLWRAR
ncbi:MAG TPA: ABC transporter substrate-binding protein [Kofleriaceae bacterium]|nr:ABC transporter substrate-binding protein [Kofleriaceae bacterium]